MVVGTSGKRTIAVVCSSIEDLCREWATGFAAQTSIEVVMVRMSSGEALARLSRPGGLSDFDVWHGGPADAYELAKTRGLLQAYRSPAVEAIPPDYRDADGYWAGTYLGVLGFCSNRERLQRLGVPVPTSWDDLLHPALRGQVSAPNPVTSGTGYTVLWATRLRMGPGQPMIDYLQRLDANVLQYTSSGMAPARVAGRGEAAVALTFSQHCVKARAEGYSDLVVSYPHEGTGFEVGSVAVLTGARDLPAARAYVDYALSASAQLAGGYTHSEQLPTRSDIDVDPQLGRDARLLRYTAAEAAAAKVDLTNQFETQVRR